jgi:hypothetical protein
VYGIPLSKASNPEWCLLAGLTPKSTLAMVLAFGGVWLRGSFGF